MWIFLFKNSKRCMDKHKPSDELHEYPFWRFYDSFCGTVSFLLNFWLNRTIFFSFLSWWLCLSQYLPVLLYTLLSLSCSLYLALSLPIYLSPLCSFSLSSLPLASFYLFSSSSLHLYRTISVSHPLFRSLLDS